MTGSVERRSRFRGVFLGTAVGDSVGLPAEGLSPRRAAKLFPGRWRHFGDFEATLSAALDCGGDTDTVGAIAGALAGAVTGEAGIPADWLAGLRDWPRGRRLLTQVADRLDEAARPGGERPGPVRYFWPALAVRNLLFLVVVLLHGFRRLAPPY